MAEGRDLLANKPAGRDLLASQGPDPSLGERDYAFSYGVGSSLLGGLGDVESALRYDIPKFFGAPQPKADTGFGRETVLPTSKEVKQVADYVGIPKPVKGTETAEKVGEIAPAVVAGGKGLYHLGKFGVDLAKKIPTMGKAVDAAGDLANSLKTYLGGDAKSLARERGTRQESNLREMGRFFGSEATAAAEDSKNALNVIAKPSNDEQVGDGLRKLITKNEEQLKTSADRAASVLKDTYFSEGKAKEKLGQYWSQSQTGREFLKYMQDVMNPANRGKYTDFEIAAVKDLNQQLQSIKYKGEVIRPEIEKIEKIIRDAKKLPSQATMTGADALKQQHMGKLARKLEDSVYGYVDESSKAVAGFAPTGRTFHNVYAQMMQPLNAYESQVGKVLAQELQGLKGIFTSDASQIPTKVFQSPEQIKILERMDISKDSLLPFAKQHAANELSKLKTSEEIYNWINSTKGSYLKEFPEIEKQVKTYLNTFTKNESKIAAKTSGKTAIETKASKVGQAQEKSQEYITEAIQKVENLQKREPNKMAGEATKILSDLQQKRLISPQMVAKIESEIQRVDKAYQGAEKAKQIGQLILVSGLGLSLAGGAYKYTVGN